MPFGAIYLHMGTTPNPAYIQFLRYGEKDSGITSARFPSLGFPLERQQGSPFYPAAYITGSLGMGSTARGTRAHMKIQNYTLCRGCEAQKEVQA